MRKVYYRRVLIVNLKYEMIWEKYAIFVFTINVLFQMSYNCYNWIHGHVNPLYANAPS